MPFVPSLTSPLPWVPTPSRHAASSPPLSPGWSTGPSPYDVNEPLARAAAEREFLRDIFGRVNLPLDRYRHSVLARHIPACLQLLGVRNLDHAAQRIAARPALAWSLLDLLLPGTLRFCPDDPALRQLTQRLLPALSGRMRLWNVACSEGQELYTLAALLAEADVLERCELWGSDCRPEAIARARVAEYPLEQVVPLDPAWRRANFQTLAGITRVHPRLRTAASWHVGNVFAGTESGPWHAIVWRNLSAALEPAAADGLWRQLGAALEPGGYLVVNPASNPVQGLPLERVDAGLYRKIPHR